MLEAYPEVASLEKFRVYLGGIHFVIVTDCSAFRDAVKKKEVSRKVARWAEFMEDFHYEMKHRPGTSMKHVDALSRYAFIIREEINLIN